MKATLKEGRKTIILAELYLVFKQVARILAGKREQFKADFRSSAECLVLMIFPLYAKNSALL